MVVLLTATPAGACLLANASDAFSDQGCRLVTISAHCKHRRTRAQPFAYGRTIPVSRTSERSTLAWTIRLARRRELCSGTSKRVDELLMRRQRGDTRRDPAGKIS